MGEQTDRLEDARVSNQNAEIDLNLIGVLQVAFLTEIALAISRCADALEEANDSTKGFEPCLEVSWCIERKGHSGPCMDMKL